MSGIYARQMVIDWGVGHKCPTYNIKLFLDFDAAT